MTAEELQTEWNYRFDERLAIFCGPIVATEAQKEIARRESNEAVRRLREN
jgi:hypothetical protein